MSDIYDKWNYDSVEITSRSVENILEPLVLQVSLLVNHKGPSSRKKGLSKQGDTVLAAIKEMLKDFLLRGEEIMMEAPERQKDFRVALQDVERTGKEMCRTSELFLTDSCNIEKRKAMINGTKAMLSSVTRLMILADIVDVYLLLRSARQVETTVESIRNSSDMQNLIEIWKDYGVNVSELIDMSGMRQRDLIDDRKRNEMAAARGILKLQTPMLITTSKAYVRHPELASAKANRDYVIKSVCDAVEMINIANKGSGNNKSLFYEKPGEITTAIDDFDKHAVIKLQKFTDADGNSLSNKISRIVKDSSVLASSPCTRAGNKQAIINEGKAAEKNVQNLIKAYKACQANGSSTNELRDVQSKMLQCTEKLRVNLKRAVADHISDTFLDIQEPLKMLVVAAKSGNEDRVESIAPYFSETVSKLIEVANLACSVSQNHEGVKIVRLSAHQVENLFPQVVNAARVLVLRPSSKFALENMEVFQTTFSSCLTTLSEAVDNITNIWDHLAVLDAHVAEDIKECISSGKGGLFDEYYQNITVLRNRVVRLCEAVHGEMEGFRKSEYRIHVEECLRDIEKQILPTFDKFVDDSLEKMRRGEKLDENKLRDALGEVYDGVHEVWQAVVLDRDQSGYETDRTEAADNEESDQDFDELANQEDMLNQIENEKSEKAVMKMISGQHKEEIDKEMAGFFEQRKRLMHETTKWDESANDIVLIAKNMCVIMMEMTDFTRGKGPLKSTTEVINSANKISEFGSKLNGVITEVLKTCPNSTHKSDLEKYLERVTLYCHQLKITSRVKADVQSIGGEIIVSGLDSVTSLIESSKNLMAAVVETVKASYIASTKYKGTNQQSVVQWRMKAPKKKPLIYKDRTGDENVRRSQRFKKADPKDELDQFDH